MELVPGSGPWTTLTVTNGTESNGLNCTFVNKGNCGKGLGHQFICSRISQFLNEADFEQYFFNFGSIPMRSKNYLAMIHY